MARLAELIGRTLDGKYQLDKLLGQGGMGAVYLATHLGTKRPVALKVIAPQFMANEEFVERFKREAEATGRLRHPNVVNVTDFGFTNIGPSKIAYLVMEYLDGGTLGDMLKARGRLPLEVVVDIVEQIALAVDNAHQQGVIHRDLKPDNIWIEPDRRGGYNVKVLDFGLAKLGDPGAGLDQEERPATARENLTRTNLSGGTDTMRAVGVTAPHFRDTQYGGATDLEAATQIQTATVTDDLAGEEKTAVLDPAATDPSPLPEADDIEATRMMPDKTGEQARTRGVSPSGTREIYDLSTSSAAGLTRVGSVLGTPLYMSPEQCRGEALDARSDIYSLGVMAYLMLVGEPPFTGDTTELIRKHTEEPPAPVVARREDIPRAVDDTVMSALAKNPDDRPATAGSFAAALRATAESEVAIIKKAKHVYNDSIKIFLALSLAVYVPFAVIMTLLAFAFRPLEPNYPLTSAFAFWTIAFLIILTANRVHTAAVTLVIREQRLRPRDSIRLLEILKAAGRRLPSIVATALQSHLQVFVNLLKLVKPGVSAFVDHALAGSVIVMEGASGNDALTRSRELVRRQRPSAIALQVREFAATLGSLIFLPFIMAITFWLLAGPSESFFELIKPSSLLALAYCWFFLIIGHTPYAAIPLAMLYFKARQARGESIDEALVRDVEPEGIGKRPRLLSNITLAWLIIPILMLMFVTPFAIFSGGNLLISAARAGNLKEVKRRLGEKADLNARSVGGTTALMQAARSGYTEIVRILLENGADTAKTDDTGDTALIYAARSSRPDMIAMLVEAGADVNARNQKGETALIVAAKRGGVATVSALVAAKADREAKDSNGRTALSYAEENGYTDTVKLLKN
ncbi:MAG TPA: ankyrin repeat domain-containing protein [Blastocatellia bacterium]|nr:ankyrin repeat domain-containing protein [Blastocatellia bacterium]